MLTLIWKKIKEFLFFLFIISKKMVVNIGVLNFLIQIEEIRKKKKEKIGR